MNKQKRKLTMKQNHLLLKQERQLRGWSQAKVAQEIGTSAKIVSRWECGTSLPSPYFREKLCALFGKDALALGLVPLEQEERASALAVVKGETTALQDNEQALPETRLLLAPTNAALIQAESAPALSIAPASPPAVSNRRKLTLVTAGGLALMTLLALFPHVLAPLTQNIDSAKQQQEAQERVLAMEMQLFKQKGIGLSDGRFAFDHYPGRQDSSWKDEAAQALQQQATSRAVNLLTRATTLDPSDGEAQIYNENLHVLQSASPYVTIVLGLPISQNNAYLGVARADMQAAYLAQREINRKASLPEGRKLRILIANSGANGDDVAQVAQLIEARVQAGNFDAIIAVVGWPFSAQTINARDIIAAAHLPLITQTASSVQLSGSSPYFFRVNPADDQQGTALGTLAITLFHARKILVLRDPGDPYSVSLADAFSQRVGSLHAVAINNPNTSFSEMETTTGQYEETIKEAVAHSADLIFLAGLDVDAVRLAHALGNVTRTNPASATLNKLLILGGDALDTRLLLGYGSGPDAALAQQFPQDMRRLHFTSFGHVDQWTFLHIPSSQQPSFLQDWSRMYEASSIVSDNAPPPECNVLLTYDALQVVVHAAQQIHGPLTGQAVRDAVTQLGKGNVPAYQGVSGRIQFDRNGDPVDKALVVLAVEERAGKNAVVLQQVLGKFI
jgi:ABC-type branched-subunit amino acid transport system substrate-binding protein/transcriptional regulator with XRE-family HTH domain